MALLERDRRREAAAALLAAGIAAGCGRSSLGDPSEGRSTTVDAAPPGEISCPRSGACHLPGRYDPAARACTRPPAPDGTGCNDGNPCTEADRCRSGACSGTPLSRSPREACLPWRPGWDDLGQPFDGTESFVSFRQPPGTRDLTLRWRVAGGVPSTSHAVGLTVFFAGPRCLGRFGQLAASGPCLSFTRQGVTVEAAEAFDSATLALDARGSGEAVFTYAGVNPGAYDVEAMVRGDDFGVRRCPFCDAIYQAPGPFGTTARITVP